jgi:glycosyltransferase involved in cell wall biosynthesis
VEAVELLPVYQSPTVASVAVVIPCFDDGATLEAAVASVQSQDVAAEIVVVDDG